jgi:hypothetical protein
MANASDFTASGGAWTKISTATASGDSSIDFTGLDSTYDEYVVRLINVIPDTDQVDLWLRTSNDGGSTFDSGSTDYEGGDDFSNTVYTSDRYNVNNQFQDGRIGSDTNDNGVSGWVHVINPSASVFTAVFSVGVFERANSSFRVAAFNLGGKCLANKSIDAIRFLMSSGNIESGKLILYGVS